MILFLQIPMIWAIIIGLALLVLQGTVAIPNWWYPFAGPFGAWDQHIWYGDMTNIFDTNQGSSGSNPVPVSRSNGILPFLIIN